MKHVADNTDLGLICVPVICLSAFSIESEHFAADNRISFPFWRDGTAFWIVGAIRGAGEDTLSLTLLGATAWPGFIITANGTKASPGEPPPPEFSPGCIQMLVATQHCLGHTGPSVFDWQF